MSSYALPPDAAGLGGAPPGAAGPPAGGDPASMAALAAALGQGAPDLGGGGAAPDAGDAGGNEGSDLLSGMSTTDHIRAAIKHLMMAMTESSDEEESAGITKGMSGLQAILAGKQKNQKAISAAGG